MRAERAPHLAQERRCARSSPTVDAPRPLFTTAFTQEIKGITAHSPIQRPVSFLASFASASMLLLLAGTFLFRHSGAIAAPVSTLFPEPLINTTSVCIQNDPIAASSGRSVWGIIWSCLATTLAVTWLSVHPNIPWLNEDEWSFRRRKLFLMFVALLTPEVMVVWAFKQWRGAVKIKETMNKARPLSYKKWSMTHAHWLQMGGFKVAYAVGGSLEAPEGELDSIITFTPEAVLEPLLKFAIFPVPSYSVAHMRCFRQKFESAYSYKPSYRPAGDVREIVLVVDTLKGLMLDGKIDFPQISEEEIADQSKGDALSKGVALLQITWFIFQLISRTHQRLDITQIELTTAALAGLNSIMYLFWWSKPLDVRCPIVIRTKKVERLLLVQREEMCRKEREDLDKEDRKCSEEAKLTSTDTDNLTRSVLGEGFSLSAYLWSVAGHSLEMLRLMMWRFMQRIILDVAILLHWHQLRNGTRGSFYTLRSVINRLITYHCGNPSHACKIVTGSWTHVKSVFRRMQRLLLRLTISPMFRVLNIMPYHKYEGREPAEDGKVRIQNMTFQKLFMQDRDDMNWLMSMMFYSEHAYSKPLLFSAALIGATFGAMHCVAWNYYFASDTERILWRTVSLTTVGLCLWIILGVAEILRSWAILRLFLRVFPHMYTFCRISFLIIALLSLRDLSDSALESVTWTQYIPHI